MKLERFWARRLLFWKVYIYGFNIKLIDTGLFRWSIHSFDSLYLKSISSFLPKLSNSWVYNYLYIPFYLLRSMKSVVITSISLLIWVMCLSSFFPGLDMIEIYQLLHLLKELAFGFVDFLYFSVFKLIDFFSIVILYFSFVSFGLNFFFFLFSPSFLR